MPRLPLLNAKNAASTLEGGLEGLNRKSPQILHTRDFPEDETRAATRKLAIIGLICGTIIVLGLSGIMVCLVIRRRLPRTRPGSSRVHYAYTQTRTSGIEAEDKFDKETPEWDHIEHRYDPENAYGLPMWLEDGRRHSAGREPLRLDTSPSLLGVPKSTSLMRSATSPPPFQQEASGQRGSSLVVPAQPHAELCVGNTPIETSPRRSRLGPYIPPSPASWASINPTESGWTGPGGVASIRDEGFGDDSDESFSYVDDKNKVGARPLMDDDRESQYTRDSRKATERAFGPFKLSVGLFGTTKHIHPETDSVFDSPSKSPRSLSSNAAACSFPGGHRIASPSSRTVYSTGTDAAEQAPISPVSSISGQILSVLSERVAAPLLRGVGSLRRARVSGDERGRSNSGNEAEHLVPSAEAPSGGALPTAYSPPVRRLPTRPDSVSYTTQPILSVLHRHPAESDESQVLPIPLSQSPPPLPDAPSVPRPVSFAGPEPTPFLSVSDPYPSKPSRTTSESTATMIRPLPVLPVVRS
ncbi:hypothetical protein FRC09_017080 [Ceratobasidium sp. 395]|nr:hypothetical protein FRC09_017080 [Ceratobasidium sp. 395]